MCAAAGSASNHTRTRCDENENGTVKYTPRGDAPETWHGPKALDFAATQLFGKAILTQFGSGQSHGGGGGTLARKY